VQFPTALGYESRTNAANTKRVEAPEYEGEAMPTRQRDALHILP